MKTKNIKKIIISTGFCAALIFTSCSPEESVDRYGKLEANNRSTWFAAAPSAKIAIAVDEDNYDGLLDDVKESEKPTSRLNIEIKNGKCILNFHNKDFTDYFFIDQKIELDGGNTYYYKKSDLSNQKPIVANKPIDMNKSFPLVTNIAYSTLNKIDIDKYAPMIDPMVEKLATGFILQKITQEGGYRIDAMNLTLNYSPEMTLFEYLSQIKVPSPYGYGEMSIGMPILSVLNGLTGDLFDDEFLYQSTVMEAIPVLIPAIIKYIKPLSINKILEIGLSKLGPVEQMAASIVTPLVNHYIPEPPMRAIPLIDMQNSLIESTKYLQANLKSVAKIQELTIIPTRSTVSLKKLKFTDKNNSILTNTMNFKFASIKLAPIEDKNLSPMQPVGYNTLFVPIINFVIPTILNNPNMLPGSMGQTIGKANDFNYTITSSITKN